MVRTLLITMTLCFSMFSFACVCSDFEISPKVKTEHLDQSQFQIFTGKVLKVESATIPIYSKTKGLSEQQKKSTRTIQLITILVIKSYGNKVKTDTVQIATGHGAPDCGVSFFKKNKKFLFTVVKKKNKGEDYFWTTICLPNKPLKEAQADIEFIEKNQNS